MAPVWLGGSSVVGRVDLWWDPPAAGSVAVVAWQVHRDETGSAAWRETEDSAQPAGPDAYGYNTTKEAAAGQHPTESKRPTVAEPNPPMTPERCGGRGEGQ